MSQATFDLIQLFEAVKQIHLKYKPLLESKEHSFNIFTILRPEHDEVNLHSRFLFELLNPRGTHQQQTAFLALFLQQLNLSADFDLENVYVGREEGNVDILVRNQTQAIIIENKIYAGDQPSQLQRYYAYLQRQGSSQIWIIYLTLDGHEPSPDSIGLLNDHLITISYGVEIDTWLDACLQITELTPAIREVLIQYKTLVKRLTGQSQSKEYIMEIKDLLLQDNNLQLALDIDEAIDEASIEIQLKFWQELEAALQARGHQILKDFKYSRQKVEDFYLKSRNNRYYGLMLDLGKLNPQERLGFSIEVGDEIYYGFTIGRGDNWFISKQPKFDKLVGLISRLDKDFERTEGMLGWKFPQCCKLNFDNFREHDTASLLQPEKRAALVNKLAEEIDSLIKRFLIEHKK